MHILHNGYPGRALFFRVKGLVLGQGQVVGIINQGIPGDSGPGLVRLRQASVNDEKLPSRLYRRLSLLDFNGHVAVDNMGTRFRKPKLLQDPVTRLFLDAEPVIRIHRFFMSGRVLDKIVLEGRHLAFTVNR